MGILLLSAKGCRAGDASSKVLAWDLPRVLRGEGGVEPDRVIDLGSPVDADALVVTNHTVVFPGVAREGGAAALVELDFWGR